MKKVYHFLILLFALSMNAYAQDTLQDARDSLRVLKMVGFSGKNGIEASWDQGVPLCFEDDYIMGLIDRIGFETLRTTPRSVTKQEAKLCREIGIAFYNRGMYDAADWYLARVRGFVEVVEIDPEIVTKNKENAEDKPVVSANAAESIANDIQFLRNLPLSYDNIPLSDLKNIAKEIDSKLKKLISERDAFIAAGESKEVIDAKNTTITTLGKEKNIVELSIDKNDLEKDVVHLEDDNRVLQKYLWGFGIGITVLILIIVALLQRKTIKVKDSEIIRQLEDINKKNTYLEYAARIIRHDMHSGINTYMPRGLSSLQKRITPEIISDLKIGPSLQMIQDGLLHTQKVYKNVYEFTNLVKVKSDFSKTDINVKDVITKYLFNTSYYKQVEIEDMDTILANEQLFCNAIDNLIKNGLKYNENKNKIVKIYREKDNIIVEDNGIGLSSEKFEEYIKRGVDIESETGLGLGIAKAILEEHNFKLSCEEIQSGGTKIKIRVNK
jgi:light-regulated signal transduction histidine kinase (bacteriophytochrome)